MTIQEALLEPVLLLLHNDGTNQVDCSFGPLLSGSRSRVEASAQMQALHHSGRTNWRYRRNFGDLGKKIYLK